VYFNVALAFLIICSIGFVADVVCVLESDRVQHSA